MAEGQKIPQLGWAALWIAKGGDPTKAKEASAVVMAESGGRTKVTSYTGCCHGGYQFHHDYFDQKCAESAACATEMAIKESKNGTDWSAWEAHTNGAFEKYMRSDTARQVDRMVRKVERNGPEAAAQFVKFPLEEFFFGGSAPEGPLGDEARKGADALGDVVTGIPDAISTVGDVLGEIARVAVGAGELILTPEGWVRMGKLLGGALLLIYGLTIVAKKGFGVGSPVGKVVKNIPAKKAMEAAS